VGLAQVHGVGNKGGKAMTDNITLRRAAEKAREALVVAWQSTPVWQIAEARNALDAALAEQDAKREPATDATDNRRVWDAYIEAFRAAERFHGIRKEDKP
jgi:hypothetical protein